MFREQVLYRKKQVKLRKQKQVLKLLDQCKTQTHERQVTKTSIEIKLMLNWVVRLLISELIEMYIQKLKLYLFAHTGGSPFGEFQSHK